MEATAAALPELSDLYRRHRKRAVAIARRILKDADAAEDVVQEIFSRLWARSAHFDGRSAVSTWLYRVTVNSSINTLRAERRRAKLSLTPASPLTPEELTRGKELEARFLEALAQVSEQHRQVLWLRELRGLSYPEIACLLHIPEGTVKSALNRGRARIEALLCEESVTGDSG